MADPLRVALVVVLIVVGLAMAGYAGYLQYVSLPEDHTFARRSRRAALALAGVTLILLGTQLLP
jgi:hypothetical protein